jgi:hypothetical protein
MGYTTYFEGGVTVTPALNAEEIAYLNKFNSTRRMHCKQGPYYVERGGYMGQDYDPPNVIDYNEPPPGQPSLWCQWAPSEDGTSIAWDGGEKFYNAGEWMTYIIEHFVGPAPKAKSALPFLQGHKIEGTINAQGEDRSDVWRIIVTDGVVRTERGEVTIAYR